MLRPFQCVFFNNQKLSIYSEPKVKVNAPKKDSKAIIVVISISCTLPFVVIAVVVWLCSVLKRKRASRKETIPVHGKEHQDPEEPVGGKEDDYKENTAVVLSVLDLSKPE